MCSEAEVIVRENAQHGRLSTEELMAKAEEQLHEKPEWRDRDIQAFREMILSDPELDTPTDDAFLLRFLRARKFDYDRAFRLIQRYYRLRSKNPELYAGYYPSAVLNAFKNDLQMMLPGYDQKGRKVFVFQAGKWDPEQCTMEDIFIANQLCLEYALQEEQTQILGIASVVDMKNLSLYQLKYVRPQFLRNIAQVVQDSFPVRFAEYHIINEPYIFEMVFMMVKPFLSEKTKSRIFFHGNNLNSLHEHIAAKILPEELGGDTGKLDNSSMVKDLLTHEEHFRRYASYGYTKRKTSMTKPSVSDRLMENIHHNICVDEKK